jgi:hypothetical protein
MSYVRPDGGRSAPLPEYDLRGDVAQLSHEIDIYKMMRDR